MISEDREWPLEGQYIDFRDKDNNSWQVGLVLTRVKDMMKVRSEGWAAKYDEFIPANSSKIRPFRSVVKGYTGQQKNPSPRDHWKWTVERHQERLQKFKVFVSGVSEKSKEEVDQFVRGEHFFYLDFLMTQVYSTKEQLTLAYDYFRAHLAYTKQYLEGIGAVGVERWCGEDGMEGETVGSMAWRQSYFQLFEGINIMTGLYPRQATFLKSNEKVIKQLFGNSTHDKEIGKLLLETKFEEGYLSLLALLHEQTVVLKRRIPISFVYSFFHLFLPVEKGLMAKTDPPFNVLAANKEERKKIVAKLLEIIKLQLQYLAPADLKNFQTERQIESLLTQMKPCYFKYGLQQLVFEYIEKTKLKVSVLLIQCDTLERKLKGISKLKQICDSLLIVNEFSGFRLSRQVFAELVSEQSVIKHLYLENEHPEILKRGSEMCQLFFREQLIGLEQMVFIWRQCSHKHEAVRKIIYLMWIDITQYVRGEQLDSFVQPIFESVAQKVEGEGGLFVEQWQVELLFGFIHNVLKFYSKVESHAKGMETISPELLRIGYGKLISLQKSNNFVHLLGEFAKVINVAAEHCNAIIRESYSQIAENRNLSVNIPLLTQFYLQSTSKQTCVPANAVDIIFNTLKTPTNKHLAPSIFRLLDEVITFSGQIENAEILSKESFAVLWSNAQQSEETKQQFYSWLLKKNSEGLFGVALFEINSNIPPALKSEIFLGFLCDHSKLDYFALSIHEFELFRQFLLWHNEAEGRLEVKKLMNLVKVVRVREGEIVGNKQMWDIFLNCENEAVIRQVSRMMLSLHFHFEDAVDFKVKRAKAVVLMTRLQKHIKDGFRKGNLKLMKHSLILLKDVIDFVKERPAQDSLLHNYQQYFKTTIKVYYEKERLELQIFFGVTYYEIKGRIAEMLKLDRTQIQLISSRNEEIALEFGEVPFCFMQEKVIRVYRLTETDETIPKVVLNFIKDRIENTLIDMLQDELICENVYHVLEDIEIKLDEGEALLDKLGGIIARQEKQKAQNGFSNYEIYFHLFYQRILQFMIERPKFLRKFIVGGALGELVKKIIIPINHPLIVPYIANATESIFKILKRARGKEFDEETLIVLSGLYEPLKQNCMAVTEEICSYINANIDEGEAAPPKRIKILFNCLNIIENVQQSGELVRYLITHPRFAGILQRVYLRESYSEIRFILAEKLKKFMKNSREKGPLSLELETKLGELFIGFLYGRARKVEGDYCGNKKVIHLYRFIASLVRTLSREFFEVYVVGKEKDFYGSLIANLQTLADPGQTTQPLNFILSGHLNILAAIYSVQPALLSEGAPLDFLLYDCLFYREGKTTRSDVRCKKPESIKEALQALKAVSLDPHPAKLMLVLKQLDLFHKISYWRTSEHWSTVIENELKAKYVGLENPGCICYLNSLLQQLFMTEDFRDNVYALNLEQSSVKEESRFQTLKGLKELFLQLEHSQQIDLSPVFFTKTIKGADNKSMIKLGCQMDIDEFCSILFDKMEQQLSFMPLQRNFIKESFGGVFAHQIISRECVHSSEREEQFLSIGLQVKKSVLQSFGALVKGETLDGENKYFCEKCDKKVKAEKMLTIKTFPQHLILSLKRFEFNYEIDTKIKINEFCEFPTELDLKRFSQQQINKVNTSEEVMTDEGEEGVQPKVSELPEEYFRYKLKGVVVHTGSADSGHYYSFIEDGERNWFEFNDSSVSAFDVKNLPEQAFGCKDSFEEKTKNAYLIFYEKVAQKQAEKPVRANLSENAEIIRGIVHKNKLINKFRLIFSGDYSLFIDGLVSNSERYQLDQEGRQQWNSFLLCFYLLVKIREGRLEEIIAFSHVIEEKIRTDQTMRDLYLSTLSSFRFMEEVFVYCPVREKCKIVAHLLRTAFLLYYEGLGDGPFEKGSLLSLLLENIYLLFQWHGNVYELELFLREVLAVLAERKDLRLVSLIAVDLQLSRVILFNLFGLGLPRQQKQICLQAIDKQLTSRPSLTGNHKNEGRKYLPTNTKQSWHLLQLFIEFLVNSTKQNEESLVQEQKLAEIEGTFDKIEESGALTRIIHECGTQKSVYHLYHAFRSTNALEKLITASEKGLKDYESTKYRPFMLLLRCILLDPLTTEQTVVRVIEMLQTVHKVNDKYFLQVNFLHQWMLLYVRESEIFLRVLSRESDFLVEVVNWMITRALPSADLLKKHKNPANERLINRMHGIMVSTDAKQYEKLTKTMRGDYESILKRKNAIAAVNVDLQGEMRDEFEIGASTRSFEISTNRWSRGKVVANDFSLLKVAMEGNEGKQLHFWADCQRLEPFRETEQEPVVENRIASEQPDEDVSDEAEEHEDEQDLYN